MNKQHMLYLALLITSCTSSVIANDDPDNSQRDVVVDPFDASRAEAEGRFLAAFPAVVAQASSRDMFTKEHVLFKKALERLAPSRERIEALAAYKELLLSGKQTILDALGKLGKQLYGLLAGWGRFFKTRSSKIKILERMLDMAEVEIARDGTHEQVKTFMKLESGLKIAITPTINGIGGIRWTNKRMLMAALLAAGGADLMRGDNSWLRGKAKALKKQVIGGIRTELIGEETEEQRQNALVPALTRAAVSGALDGEHGALIGRAVNAVSGLQDANTPVGRVVDETGHNMKSGRREARVWLQQIEGGPDAPVMRPREDGSGVEYKVDGEDRWISPPPGIPDRAFEVIGGIQNRDSVLGGLLGETGHVMGAGRREARAWLTQIEGGPDAPVMRPREDGSGVEYKVDGEDRWISPPPGIPDRAFEVIGGIQDRDSVLGGLLGETGHVMGAGRREARAWLQQIEGGPDAPRMRARADGRGVEYKVDGEDRWISPPSGIPDRAFEAIGGIQDRDSVLGGLLGETGHAMGAGRREARAWLTQIEGGPDAPRMRARADGRGVEYKVDGEERWISPPPGIPDRAFEVIGGIQDRDSVLGGLLGETGHVMGAGRREARAWLSQIEGGPDAPRMRARADGRGVEYKVDGEERWISPPPGIPDRAFEVIGGIQDRDSVLGGLLGEVATVMGTGREEARVWLSRIQGGPDNPTRRFNPDTGRIEFRVAETGEWISPPLGTPDRAFDAISGIQDRDSVLGGTLMQAQRAMRGEGVVGGALTEAAALATHARHAAEESAREYALFIEREAAVDGDGHPIKGRNADTGEWFYLRKGHEDTALGSQVGDPDHWIAEPEGALLRGGRRLVSDGVTALSAWGDEMRTSGGGWFGTAMGTKLTPQQQAAALVLARMRAVASNVRPTVATGGAGGDDDGGGGGGGWG